jgi:hypothetical protein
MTLRWTSDTPTEPGWYWLKRKDARGLPSLLDHFPVMTCVVPYKGVMSVRYGAGASSSRRPVDWLVGAEWAGPIPPPQDADYDEGGE